MTIVRWAALVLAAVCLPDCSPAIADDAPVPAASGDTPAVRYESHIRPIFKAMCFQCHGEEPELQGGLDLRLVRLMVAGGDSGSAVEVGNAAESLLWQRIEADEMPEGAKKLSASEKKLIRQWIDAGAATVRPEPDRVEEARYTPEELEHWAFQPVRRPSLPSLPGDMQADSPIDAFIAEQLAAHGLDFSPEADRPTLIRRLSFDLTGLPPTPADVARFVDDPSPDAYGRLVDRLLASPHYGERWGRHWLDVAGFAETEGNLHRDQPRPHAWRYRDYVLSAWNEDLPYDRFLVEQLAGDELIGGAPDPENQQHVRWLAATGLLRMGPDVTGSDNTLVDRNQAVADMLTIVSSATVGLSIGCAQCHDHRYDPISTEDYYGYRAVFDPAFPLSAWKRPQDRLIDVTPAAQLAEEERIELAARELEQALTEVKRGLAEEVYARLLAEVPEPDREALAAVLEQPVKDRTPEDKSLADRYPMLHPVSVIQQRLNLYEPKRLAELADQPQKEIDDLRAGKPPRVLVMGVAETSNPPPASTVFFRGNPEQPGDEVEPGEIFVVARTRDALPIPMNDEGLPSSGRRLAYARHLTDGRHPLTARVAVNRLWLHHFGRGLVATPGDFGLAGEPPSHPALLDWLADELVQGEWHIKRIHKLIVTSRTYRQAATRTPRLDAVDPDNRLLGRMHLRRLDAESIRDAMLVAGGRLSPELGGPSVPVGRELDGRAVIGNEIRRNSLPAGVEDIGVAKYRRSVYIESKRSVPLSLLEAFDLPTMTPNCQARKTTNVAPQALLMLNDGSVIELAESIARQMSPRDHDTDDTSWAQAIEELFVRLFAVPATSEEQRLCREFLAEQTARLEANPDPAWRKQLEQDPAAARVGAFATLVQSLLATNRFLYVE